MSATLQASSSCPVALVQSLFPSARSSRCRLGRGRHRYSPLSDLRGARRERNPSLQMIRQGWTTDGLGGGCLLGWLRRRRRRRRLGRWKLRRWVALRGQGDLLWRALERLVAWLGSPGHLVRCVEVGWLEPISGDGFLHSVDLDDVDFVVDPSDHLMEARVWWL